MRRVLQRVRHVQIADLFDREEPIFDCKRVAYAGVKRFVNKPYVLDELVEVLKT